jgi:glycerol-3-phosphate dehydrogenase
VAAFPFLGDGSGAVPNNQRVRADPRELDGRRFDAVVVGGGIHGAALAREIALRRGNVLLVERDDFGSGTSMRSSRLVHGGIRYLEQGRLGLVYEALHERERLLRLAPHLVRPLPMLMPFFRDGGKSPFLLRVGLRVYTLLAGRSRLPRPSFHGPADCARLFPGLRAAGLTGGALFFDAATVDLRLCLAVMRAAAGAGALLCNHAELIGIDGDRVRIRDRVWDVEVAVRAAAVFNAAGPHLDEVRRRLGIEGAPLVRWSRGSHLVLPPVEHETALGAFLPDGRIQFVIPHEGGVLCGTTERDEAVGDGAPTVPEEDAEYLLSSLSWLLAPAPERGDVRFAYAGWRALPVGSGPLGKVSREAMVVVERGPAGPVHTIVGGKLTTHRALAERAVNRWLRRRDPSPSRTEALPGGAGPQEPADPLWRRHGSLAAEVRALAAADPELIEPVSPGYGFLAAEAAYAVAREGAVTLTDLALRRLHRTCGPALDEATLARLLELLGRHRPPGLPPLDAAAEVAQLREEVRRMAGPFGDAIASPGSARGAAAPGESRRRA